MGRGEGQGTPHHAETGGQYFITAPGSPALRRPHPLTPLTQSLEPERGALSPASAAPVSPSGPDTPWGLP